MGSDVNTVKYSAKVERPDVSSRNSFPSGHTANSFMNASFLHKEYGGRSPLYSVGAYTAATATAVGRQMNNRHWISDVFAGCNREITLHRNWQLRVHQKRQQEYTVLQSYTSGSNLQILFSYFPFCKIFLQD